MTIFAPKSIQFLKIKNLIEIASQKNKERYLMNYIEWFIYLYLIIYI